MAAASIPSNSTPNSTPNSTQSAQAPQTAVPNETPAPQNVTIARKVNAAAVIVFALVASAISFAFLPAPLAISFSAVILTVALIVAICILDSHPSVTVIEDHRPRSYFWHRIWSPPVYVPPIIVTSPVRRSAPVYVPSITGRARPHARVGGGGFFPVRSSPSPFRSVPPVRVSSGGVFPSSIRSTPSSFGGGRVHVMPGSRR